MNEMIERLNLDDVTYYGEDIVKINKVPINDYGKLILVTAINPTKYGEGKTTVTIGLIDALNKLSINAGGALREPSLGPVFGFKGGAIGGGKSKVEPEDKINLHFTGDFHAVTSANNLLASVIDNHIYQGNELGIEKVTFKRCIDINDRSLRDKFNITAASEVMSILVLSKDIDDLKRRLGNIIVGFKMDGKPVFAKELKIVGAMTSLLVDAIKPNLVKTLEGNPVIIHGGPFANISVGTNSVIGTKAALNLFEYTVTEAGFGSELGAEKFLDIKTKLIDKTPDAVVLVTTINSLIYQGGLDNLRVHIENLKKFNVNIIVALNKHDDDREEDINRVKELVESYDIEFSIVTSFTDGGNGSIDLAEKVVKLSSVKKELNYMYDDNDKVEEKISKLSYEIYHAGSINYSDNALKMIDYINNNGIKYPICVAKTQYSISDDKNRSGYPRDYELNVKNIEIFNGAELIVVYLNDIITLPGLTKNSNYMNIDVDKNGNIVGLV